MTNEETQTKDEYDAEVYISEVCIVGKDAGKAKLKPADGFGMKVPETSRELIAFINAKGGVLLSADTLFAFPPKADIDLLLSLKQQHAKLLLTIDVNNNKIVSISVK